MREGGYTPSERQGPEETVERESYWAAPGAVAGDGAQIPAAGGEAWTSQDKPCARPEPATGRGLKAYFALGTVAVRP